MKIRVVNPSGSGPRRKRRSSHKRQSAGTGGVFIVAKKKSRRRRVGNSHRSRSHRRSNPFGFGGGRVKRHRSRRRRNPGMGGFGVRDLTGTILWGTAGALSARVIPSTFLGTKNTGILGYGANGATAVIGGMLVGKFLNPRAGQEFTAGGLIALGLRLFEDWMGGGSQLNGDLGFYIENSFPLPTSGSGPYLLNAGYNGSPMASVQAPAQVALPAAAAAVAADGGSDTPSRWNKFAS
jgi:hypothetical protein